MKTVPPNLPQLIAAKASEIGFELCGFASAEPSRRAEYWQAWIDSGRAGQMTYLAERLDERLDLAVYFPGAKSAIVVGKNYYLELEPPADGIGVPGRIGRYALSRDYHSLIKPRLYDLADWLRETVPGCQTRCGVDTAPIPERELAARAGIGWVGKNTCVINREMGSFIFLGVVLTTLEIATTVPETDHCGTCTRCLDACPTRALTPYQLDASRCISYLTIEHAGPINPALAGQMGDWLYGCDICQDVCPHNGRALPTSDPRFAPVHPSGVIDAEQAARWGREEFLPVVRHTAMKRISLEQFRRNAEIVVANSGRGGGGAPTLQTNGQV